MMYYRISKNEKNLFFGKKNAQVWAVTLSTAAAFGNSVFLNGNSCQMIDACIFMTPNETRDLKTVAKLIVHSVVEKSTIPLIRLLCISHLAAVGSKPGL